MKIRSGVPDLVPDPTQDSSLDPPKSAPELSEAKRRLLAQRLRGAGPGEGASSQIAEPASRRLAGSKTPICVDQYRIWLHASMQPDLPIYNEQCTLHCRGHFKPEIFEASFNEFLRRHEAWRTSFLTEQGEVAQIVHPELRVKLRVVDLSGLPEGRREREAQRLATELGQVPIDPGRAPLFRTLIVRMAPDYHRVYLILHHIVCDGVSIRQTFFRELTAIYAARRVGRPHGLPEPILQYCDYSLWRERQVSSATMESHLEYWREALGGQLPVLHLPSEKPRPAAVTQKGSLQRFSLPAELTNSLRELGRTHGASLYVTLLASFKTLLFRYSGQEDLIVGSAADGRRRPELLGVVGYIVDTFAIRTRPSSQLPFSSYLKQVKTAALEAMSQAEVPFDRVVEAIQTGRDSRHHSILQAFFAFQPLAGDAPPGWKMTHADISMGAAKFDVYVEAEECAGGAAIRIAYRTDLLDDDAAQRMCGHWLTLLEGAVKTPDCPIGELPLLTEDERKLMLVKWNDRSRPLPETTLHGLVEAQVRRTPERTAVQFGETSWTYAQLDERAALIASHLRDAGAKPGVLAAILLERSENLLAGLLGILKAGAAYLPLDPKTPRARVLLSLEEAAPPIMLTQRALALDLPACEARILILEDIVEAGPSRSAGDFEPAMEANPDDLAYVIHTSGSTGRPKGVELRHRSVVNLLLSMKREPGFTADDALLAVSTISFDIATLDVFLPLISGGRVVIATREEAIDPRRLSEMLRAYNCTVMQATPATWRALLAADWPGYPGLKALSGGEALSRDLAESLLALGLDLWNLYGPTETTIYSTGQRVLSGEGPVPIGRPIDNTTVYILDRNRQPVPIGVPGEIYIGGVGLATGYRGRPDLTSEKFLPVSIAGGARLYRSGDNAIYRSDGSIECQGRADNQVKVRGYRIELEDVEANLNAHPGVAMGAARVWPDAAGGNRLSAYLVGKNGPAPDRAEIREFLQTRVPDYMIPSDVVALDAMPLMANGKLDRKALPQPTATSTVPEMELPETETEKKLAEIWSRILGIPAIGRNDNFFELGGHSLALVRLFERINREFASSLPITAIFNAETLSALAGIIKEKTQFSSLVPVQTAGGRPPLFMVHSYLLYRGLSSALGTQQPFYGLRELEGEDLQSLHERASRYVADMRSIQRTGPYHIAGWCAAAPIAVEIAGQLLGAGEKIGSLILLDAVMPGHLERLRAENGRLGYAGTIAKRLRLHKEKMSGIAPGRKLEYVRDAISHSARQARDAVYLQAWMRMDRIFKRLAIPMPQFLHNTSLGTFAALRDFRGERMPVRITLIRARDAHDADDGPASFGWEEVAALGVDVLWAPGDHESMFIGDNLQVTLDSDQERNGLLGLASKRALLFR